MKQRVAKLALAAVSMMFMLIFAEQLLRLTGFEYRPMKINLEKPGDARLVHVFQDDHFSYDPVLIWRPRRRTSVFNNQGFRGPELAAEKAPGTVRIFAVGDSNTLGWAKIGGGSNWPGALAGRLGKEFELVNAGVWGYSSFQGLERLREVLTYRPDLVLVSFGSNDAHLVSRPDREFVAGSLFVRPALRGLLDYRLGQLGAAAWDRLTTRAGEGRHRVDLPEYRENLRRMIDLCREQGAEIVLLTRPYIGPVGDPTLWKNFAHEYNLATVETAEEEGIPVVDIYSFFKEEASLFNDESHFTPEGHELAADIMLAHLRTLLERIADNSAP